MFYVYIIRSLKNGSYYKGFTSELNRRLKEHNAGNSPATARYAPWKLVWFAEKTNRSEAIELERKLKNLTSRSRLEAFIEKYS